MSLSAQELAKAIVAAGLSSSDQVEELQGSLAKTSSGHEFAYLLVQRKLLTDFQATELLRGGETPLVLGSYEILDRIGAGGMGRVFKARHLHMDRIVALKLLSEKLTSDSAAIQRFRREVKAAARLAHPHIVQAHDAGLDQGQWFLVMEFVDGQDLGALVKQQGMLPIRQSVDYIRQAAQGLAFAHASGIVHRDIKPENLLLTARGTIKILDMGLARVEDADGLTQGGDFMGTVDYMAPEQFQDVRTADARADIYSLGCTLFRLLTGRRLFEGETSGKRLLAHQSEAIPRLRDWRPDAPLTLAAVFQRMVQKKPQDRFQSMQEVDAALQALSSELAPNTPSSPSTPSAAVDPPLDFSSNHTLSHVPELQPRSSGQVDVAHEPEARPEFDSRATVAEERSETAVSTSAAERTSLSAMSDSRSQPTTPPWWQPSSIRLAYVGAAVLILYGVSQGFVLFSPSPPRDSGPPPANVNTKPTISKIPNQQMTEDLSLEIPFTIGDRETTADFLAVSAVSSNPELFPAEAFQLRGNSSNRIISLTPGQDRSGTAQITLTVRDGIGGTTQMGFTVTVAPFNDPPVISQIADQTTSADKPILSVPFTVADGETPASSLQVSAESSDPALIPASNIGLSGSGGDRKISVTPANGQTGQSTITVTVKDDMNVSTTQTFKVTVRPNM